MQRRPDHYLLAILHQLIAALSIQFSALLLHNFCPTDCAAEKRFFDTLLTNPYQAAKGSYKYSEIR